MKEKLLNNPGLKALSVILAVLTWLVVVNVSNPLVTDSRELQVEMKNEEVLAKSNLTYEMTGKNTVTVNYKVRIRDRYKISAADFYAYADLAELYDVTGSIPVKVDVSNRSIRTLIEGDITTKPGVMRIQTEALQRKKFDVEVHYLGEMQDGYAMGDCVLSPQYVYLTGAVSAIGQISSVGIEVNVEGIEADKEGVQNLCLFDANGNKLDMEGRVEANVETVAYNLSILKVKNVSLDFQVGGQVADGYRFTGVECDMNTVSVEGLKSKLASINTIVIPPSVLNVEGATSDVVVEVDIGSYLPEDVTLAGGKSISAAVTLKIEKLEERIFEVPVVNIQIVGQREGFRYSFQKDWVGIFVAGLREDLDTLGQEKINVSMDVSELEPGDHEAVFTIVLADGFDVKGHEKTLIHVISPEMEDTEGESGPHGSASDVDGPGGSVSVGSVPVNGDSEDKVSGEE